MKTFLISDLGHALDLHQPIRAFNTSSEASLWVGDEDETMEADKNIF